MVFYMWRRRLAFLLRVRDEKRSRIEISLIFDGYGIFYRNDMNIVGVYDDYYINSYGIILFIHPLVFV